MAVMDLNCDLGESGSGPGAGSADQALLGLVTSANVACGGHAGDADSMLATLRAARAVGVVVGAHPSYADREGFGRRRVEVAGARLRAQLGEQLEALDAAAEAAGVGVRYVKPHGALYNAITAPRPDAAAREHAGALLDAVVERARRTGEGPLPLLVPGASPLVAVAAERGVGCVAEAFADRGYRPDGTLVPRAEPGAVLEDASVVAARVVAMARGLPVDGADGAPVLVGARSVCVHGDTPGALAMVRAIREGLAAAGVAVRSFVGEAG